MNSEQVLLIVAAVGVVLITLMAGLGSKKKPAARAAPIGPNVSRHGESAARANRAQRRKRR